MKKSIKKILAVIMAILIAAMLFTSFACFADNEDTNDVSVIATNEDATQENTETGDSSSTSSKAMAAAICLALAAVAGAISMGIAISKSADGISRQPEAEGKIRTTLMLGLVFIETLVIYALVLAILIIFVL